MAQCDGAAIDVEFAHIQLAERAVRTEFVAAVGIVLPRLDAAQHLRGEGFVDFPGVQVVQREVVALQDRRRGVHGAQAHLRRVEAGPLRVVDDADGRKAMALHRLFGGQQHPGAAVGDLR